jgi:hypothetical protein
MDYFERLIDHLSSGFGVPIKIAALLVPVLFFTAGFFTDPISATNARYFLSALATSQAGILAIVFSVTVIVVQLVTSEYSMRMIPLFTESKRFMGTFLIFIASISISLLVLSGLPEKISSIQNGLIFLAFGTTTVTFFSLLVFILASMRQGTPEGVLDTFESRITPERYLKEVQNNSEKNNSVHPLYPLRSMFMSSLSGKKRTTAEQTFQTYEQISKNTLTELADSRNFEDDDNVWKKLYKPVLNDQLSDMAFHSEEMNETKMVERITKLQRDLGKMGLHLKDKSISRQSYLSLSSQIQFSNPETGDYAVNDNSWRRLTELLVESSEHSSPEIVGSILLSIGNRGSTQLSNTAIPARRLRHTYLNVFNGFKVSQEALLDEYSETLNETTIDWSEAHVLENHPDKDILRIFERWASAFLKIASRSIEYFIETGSYPITEGNFRDTWRDVCVKASKEAPESYSVQLCKAIIDAAFISSLEDPDEEGWWIRKIAEIKRDGNPEIVDKAFKEILEYDYVESVPEARIAFNEDHEENYYWGALDVRKYSPLNGLNQFPVGIERIRKRVNGKVRELEKRREEN